MNFWNASTNQNLLHPATAPVAREIEHLVLKWLSPLFGMEGGHMTPGSTIANLTALWAARECMKIKEVVASKAAHISIAKAAHLLGLDYKEVPTDSSGRVLIDQIPTDLSRSALVLTVGTTSTGSVDSLQLIGQAAWTHIDAAWGGPLRFSNRYGVILDGIEKTDSLSMSAHKWLFQPKESAVVFFREIDKVNPIISFSGNYLSAPNVGILGSHGAVAFPLLATLLAWGKEGVSARIESCMEKSFLFADFVRSHPGLELWGVPQTGVVVWRPKQKEMIASFHQKLPKESVSLTTVDHSIWFRNTAANPNLDINRFIDIVQTTLSKENN
jgi:L-2,4-diaminobutyrate decarboxylase